MSFADQMRDVRQAAQDLIDIDAAVAQLSALSADGPEIAAAVVSRSAALAVLQERVAALS